MKKWLCIPILGLIAGELLIFGGNILSGLEIHIIGLLAIILIIMFGNLSLEEKNVLQSLILLPLLRVLSFSMPQLRIEDFSVLPLRFTDSPIFQLFAYIHLRYILIYGVIVIPIYLIIKNQHMSFKDLSVNPERFYNHLPIIILTGTVIVVIIQYAGVVSGVYTTPREILYVGGELMTTFLIISLSISLLLSDTKYWNEYNSNVLNMCTNPMLAVFAGIAISRIVLVIYT